MAKDIYGSFTKFGSKSFLLLNRVAGYCFPRAYALTSQPEKSNNHNHDHNNSITQVPGEAPMELAVIRDELSSDTFLSAQTRMEMISSIPCYCDIQFKKKEFLTVLQHPDHPFAKQLEHLAMTEQIKV